MAERCRTRISGSVSLFNYELNLRAIAMEIHLTLRGYLLQVGPLDLLPIRLMERQLHSEGTRFVSRSARLLL
jgi:hypothetical protein